MQFALKKKNHLKTKRNEDRSALSKDPFFFWGGGQSLMILFSVTAQNIKTNRCLVVYRSCSAFVNLIVNNKLYITLPLVLLELQRGDFYIVEYSQKKTKS